MPVMRSDFFLRVLVAHILTESGVACKQQTADGALAQQSTEADRGRCRCTARHGSLQMAAWQATWWQTVHGDMVVVLRNIVVVLRQAQVRQGLVIFLGDRPKCESNIREQSRRRRWQHEYTAAAHCRHAASHGPGRTPQGSATPRHALTAP